MEGTKSHIEIAKSYTYVVQPCPHHLRLAFFFTFCLVCIFLHSVMENRLCIVEKVFFISMFASNIGKSVKQNKMYVCISDPLYGKFKFEGTFPRSSHI